MGSIYHCLRGQGGSPQWDCQDLLLQGGVQGRARGWGGVRGAIVWRGCHGRHDPRSEGIVHLDRLSWLAPSWLARQICLPLSSPLLLLPGLQGRAAHLSSPRGGSKAQTQQRFFWWCSELHRFVEGSGEHWGRVWSREGSSGGEGERPLPLLVAVRQGTVCSDWRCDSPKPASQPPGEGARLCLLRRQRSVSKGTIDSLFVERRLAQ